MTKRNRRSKRTATTRRKRRSSRQVGERAQRRSIGRLLAGLVLVGLILSVSLALAIFWLAPVSSLRGSLVYQPIQSTELRTTGLAAEGFTPLSDVSPYLTLAVVACEDRRFASHGGLDVVEAGVAIWDAALHDRKLRGASTISQQLVKNVFLGADRSLWRKLREAVYTLKLEQRFSKRDILALYLDIVQLGVGLYGVRDAADSYFGKSPNALKVEEAALLVTLLPNPEGRSEWLTRGSIDEVTHNTLSHRLLKIHNVLDYVAHEQAGQPLSAAGILGLPMAAIIDRELDRAAELRIWIASRKSLRMIRSDYLGRAIVSATPGS